ncbi:EAL domain-containing protein [Vibrio sp. S11_S32]|uniref:bifunctional diguanylate cyclase/phosphodiesterase n=1 Tax=Vibrio sp. S11_S32 TaxID=2720225 RepID=UPI001680D434|nr:EAL domain-containing protein [Vibrio sp. S11_S32]MBD1577464.1 EAL domain-containing protein [Vibrio sp. S11_S32]
MTTVFGLQFNSTHTYLQQQQKIALTNAISSMNIALTPYIKDKDKIGIESVINATFDSGYYDNIHFEMLDKSQKIDRKYQDDTNIAPTWFQKLDLFKNLKQSQVLMDGWLQTATLTVTSNADNAYDELWSLTIYLLAAFIAIAIVSAFSLAFILKVMLKPLKGIQQRANEISSDQFGEPIPSVNTRELSDVVQAMNHMSQHIETYYQQSAEEARRLRIRAYQDPVSELSNRDFFITQLEPWLDSDSMDYCGVCLIQVDSINDAYENQEFQKADQLVRSLSAVLSRLMSEENTLARFSRSEFILLIPHCQQDDFDRISNKTLKIVKELSSDPNTASSASIGMLMIHDQNDTKTVFSQLDNALTQARQQSENSTYLLDTSSISPQFTKGKMEWQSLVEHAINNGLVKITLQAAIDKQQQHIQHEVFAYIEIDGLIYNANHFITALEQTPIAAQFDDHILSLVTEYLNNSIEPSPIAVNITKYSINDAQFIASLEDKLANNINLREYLYFELPEISFIKKTQSTRIFTHLLNKYGFKFGIDHFGHNFSSLEYLYQVRPHYVKLDFAYTNQLDDPAKYDVLASITRIANNLNMQTIATRVETQDQLEQLANLSISGFQGYITDAS